MVQICTELVFDVLNKGMTALFSTVDFFAVVEEGRTHYLFKYYDCLIKTRGKNCVALISKWFVLQ